MVDFTEKKMPSENNLPFFKNENISVNIGGLDHEYQIETENCFNLVFFLSSNISLEADDIHSEISIQKNSYILHYSFSKKIAKLISTSSSAMQFLHIQFEYSYISNLLDPQESNENKSILDRMIKNQFILLNHSEPPKITVEMHMIIKEITESSKKGVLQKLLIEAKIIKLLMLIFEQFSKSKNIPTTENTAQITKSFIDKYYTQQISTHDIALQFGLNETKIRSEFKSEYKITISEYINELRMLKARKMIIDREFLIKEIASECGYEYVPNFSRAFKKKYGISPDKLRNI
ncbi:AraC family transcriptional regulator [Chryseobacterium sp. Leaf394]|uniref:helix-turn-helix transcriptional regulator n=1 Tax=Chryseobacterium sp. Leaf394 TaxID=1736361 RepID=UPI000A886A8B|nr:AraC family transcriptional regulator [Chryseobacterium sp. Leaf394]